MNVAVWIFLGFQQQDRQDSQNLNNDTFYRLPVTSAQCILGTEKNPDAGILLSYDADDFSRGFCPEKHFLLLFPDEVDVIFSLIS